MTDVEGITDENGDLVSSLDRKSLDRMVAAGTVHGGMIPKVQAATAALAAGVSKVHIVDGRVDHAVLLEIFTKTGIGTEIVP
jgi:acetylglutamate kinase